MALIMVQGGNWDIRSLIPFLTWPWIVVFTIVYVLSGVVVYFKLRRPRDKSAVGRKNV